MDYRKTTLNLLEQIYGNYTEEQGSIIFENYQSKEIAQELGFDESYFSRTINHGHGKEPSVKTYQRLIQRLETVLENKQLKEQIKSLEKKNKDQTIQHKGIWMLLALLSIIVVTIAYRQLSDSGAVTTSQDYRLTTNERNAITKLYGEHIAYQIAFQAVAFNNSMKEGVYGEDIEPYLKENINKMMTIIQNSRDIIQASNLKAENGEYLYRLYEQYSINNIEKNFQESVPFITNKNISISELKEHIFKKISTVQMHNFNRIDSVIMNTNY